MHNRGLYHYHAAARSHMSTHLLCIMTREPVITAFSLKIQLPAHRWLRPSHAVIVFCDLWENYLNVLWTKCHLNKLAKDRKDRNTGTLGCYESPDPLNNKLISGGHFVKSLLWLLTCTGLLHLNRHPWAVGFMWGVQGERHIFCSTRPATTDCCIVWSCDGAYIKLALKYIQMQQDLPFSSADVHSGKSLPD